MQVFIKRVRDLAKDFTSQNLTTTANVEADWDTFYAPDGIHACDAWETRLRTAIAHSRVLLACLSEHSWQSKWCHFEWETYLGQESASGLANVEGGITPIYIATRPGLSKRDIVAAAPDWVKAYLARHQVKLIEFDAHALDALARIKALREDPVVAISLQAVANNISKQLGQAYRAGHMKQRGNLADGTSTFVGRTDELHAIEGQLFGGGALGVITAARAGRAGEDRARPALWAKSPQPLPRRHLAGRRRGREGTPAPPRHPPRHPARLARTRSHRQFIPLTYRTRRIISLAEWRSHKLATFGMEKVPFVELIACQLIEKIGPRARLSVEEAAVATILSFKTSEVLTFVQPSGVRIEPAVDVEYAKALWCFARGKDYKDASLDSAVTKPIVEATEKALVQLLNSKEAISVITGAIAPGESVNNVIKTTVEEEAQWATKEVLTAAGLTPMSLVGQEITAEAAAKASDLLNSTAGKTIIGAIAKVAMTAQGKIMIAKIITLSAGKIAASTALKSLVIAALKKVGIAMVIKVAVVKVLAAALPALVMAKIPIFWIILPILGGFIYHEMKNMPKKLASAVPPEIGRAIEQGFPDIATNFAKMIVEEAMANIARATTAP